MSIKSRQRTTKRPTFNSSTRERLRGAISKPAAVSFTQIQKQLNELHIETRKAHNGGEFGGERKGDGKQAKVIAPTLVRSTRLRIARAQKDAREAGKPIIMSDRAYQRMSNGQLVRVAKPTPEQVAA